MLYLTQPLPGNNVYLVYLPQGEEDVDPGLFGDQYEKVLGFDYKYAPPVPQSQERKEEQTPIPHTDYNFDEKDYRRKCYSLAVVSFHSSFSFSYLICSPG